MQGEALPHTIYALPEAERCAIEINSFSKTAGFTGVRCGYTVVPAALRRCGASLREMWLRRQTTKTNGVSYPVQRAAEAALSPAGQAGCRAALEIYRQNARCIAATLDELGIRHYGGLHSPYLWLACPGGRGSWKFFDELLERAGVVGTPGSGFGKNGEGYFRLTAFAGPDITRRAMRRLRELDW